MSRPTVYAIVVNYNGWRDTIECLESLLHTDYPALRVLVFDNASSDDSIAQIQRWARGEIQAPVATDPAIRVSRIPLPRPIELAVLSSKEIERAQRDEPGERKLVLVSCESNIGFAGATNIGLRCAQRWAEKEPAYALLLNNDAVIAADAIDAMIQVAEREHGEAAVGATILQYRQPERVETLAGATVSRLTGMVTTIHAESARTAPRPDSVPMDYLSGCCVLVGASAVRRVGLMDERYFLYSEDADWGLRMTKAGLRLAYSPEAEVWHKGGSSVVHRSEIHDYYVVRGALMLVQKHNAAMLPVALVHWIGRGMLSKLARGDWARLRAAGRGYRDFFRQAFRGRTRTA